MSNNLLKIYILNNIIKKIIITKFNALFNNH